MFRLAHEDCKEHIARALRISCASVKIKGKYFYANHEWIIISAPQGTNYVCDPNSKPPVGSISIPLIKTYLKQFHS
jgi:hypothetical protein